MAEFLDLRRQRAAAGAGPAQVQLALALREAPESLRPRLVRVREAGGRLQRMVTALLLLFRADGGEGSEGGPGSPAGEGSGLRWQIVDLAALMSRWPIDGLVLQMPADLRLLGITHPRQLAAADAFQLYQALCRATGQRQDPCVLDTFLAAVDFMRGAPAQPWWAYTAQRKRQFPAL